MTRARRSGPTDRERAAPLVESLAGVEDAALRRRAFLARLGGLEPDAAAGFLNGIVELSVERHAGAAALVPLVADLRTLTEALGQKAMAAIVQVARATGRGGLVRLLAAQAARRSYDDTPEAGGSSGPSSLPLGWRTQLGRTGSRDTMDRLVYDQEPGVIENLLKNPRCTEREVLRVAAHRPTSAKVLAVVFRHPTWSQRYPVKRALALNPYAAPAQAIGLLPSLLTQDLELIARDETLHADVSRAAATLLAARGVGVAPLPEPEPVLPSPDEGAGEALHEAEDGGVVEASAEMKAAVEAALKDIEAVEALVEAAGEAAARRPTTGEPETGG